MDFVIAKPPDSMRNTLCFLVKHEEIQKYKTSFGGHLENFYQYKMFPKARIALEWLIVMN